MEKFDKSYLSRSEEELLVELNKIVFHDPTALPSTKETIDRVNSWIKSNRKKLSNILCTNKKIRDLAEGGFSYELVITVFAALEAYHFGTAASPLAVLICKKGLAEYCKSASV